MAKEGKGREKSSPRGFYSRALDEAEKVELEEASHVEGIDEEIALLRVELRKLLERQPERIEHSGSSVLPSSCSATARASKDSSDGGEHDTGKRKISSRSLPAPILDSCVIKVPRLTYSGSFDYGAPRVFL